MERVPPASDIEREAVRAFGCEALTIEPVERRGVNAHWFVEATNGRRVLRRYRASRSLAAIAFEHALLRHAAARGWPVAAPIEDAEGKSVVTLYGSHFSLFPFLRGEPAPHESLAQKRVTGRLLARLHRDMASFEHTGQRDGFGRAWELDVFVQAAGGEGFNALLAAFSNDHPTLAWAVRREKYRNLRELARLGYGDLPVAPIHGDYGMDNLLFEGPQLTGLLDFDLARIDAPAYDIAAALNGECLEAPSFDGIDVGYARAFIEGYSRGRRIDEAEARLIVPLVRASILWLCLFRMLEWRDEGGDAAARSIARTVERRLPLLEARGPGITALALEASQSPAASR